MPVEPPHDRPTPRPAWGRRAAQGSAAALAALTALGAVAPAHAAPATPHSVHAEHHADAETVTVRPGDSLWAVATAHGVGVRALMAANDVPAHGMLRPGQRLVVPRSEPSAGAPSGAVAGQTRHDVAAPPRASGDAAASRTSGVAASPGTPGTAAPTGQSTSGAGTSVRHTVSAGDTLWDLALRYEVGVAQLMAANDLSARHVLRPGQRLTVPQEATRASGAATSSSRQQSSTQREGAVDPETTSAGGTSSPGAASSSTEAGGTVLGRTYPAEVVASANAHRRALDARTQPSPEQMRETVRRTAVAMGVDPALALAHASQESDFRHGVVSPADAIGTMQVLPSAGQWASELVGRELDLLDPQDNVTAGVALIRELQDRAPSRAVGIAAYYQGLHGVRTYGMYPDTKAYVKAVSAQERDFAE